MKQIVLARVNNFRKVEQEDKMDIKLSCTFVQLHIPVHHTCLFQAKCCNLTFTIMEQFCDHVYSSKNHACLDYKYRFKVIPEQQWENYLESSTFFDRATDIKEKSPIQVRNRLTNVLKKS